MANSSHRRGFPALAVLALALAGCGGGDNENTSGGKAETNGPAAANQVVMRLIAFRPGSLTVPDGTTVTWNQKDAGFHTVTSGTVTQGTGDVTTAPDGRFDSGNLPTDATFKFTFAEAGSFPYFCAVHPATMRGEVQVT
jgi:plastocyanin